jgi:hypothetical protein
MNPLYSSFWLEEIEWVVGETGTREVMQKKFLVFRFSTCGFRLFLFGEAEIIDSPHYTFFFKRRWSRWFE